MKFYEYQPLIFDSGSWHRQLTEKQRPPDRLTVFLPSGSDLRRQVVSEMLEDLGVPVVVKQVNGPYPEKGLTSLDRAVDKADHALRVLMGDGYFNRHPADLTLIAAADARNIYQGKWRDKPRSVEEFVQFGTEWERIALGEAAVIDESGYVVLAILGSEVRYFTMVDRVQLQPHRRETVRAVFIPDRFPEFCGYAHGLGSGPVIRAGEMTVVSLSGQVILGQEAVNRTYGASTTHFSSLLSTAISAMIKTDEFANNRSRDRLSD